MDGSGPAPTGRGGPASWQIASDEHSVGFVEQSWMVSCRFQPTFFTSREGGESLALISRVLGKVAVTGQTAREPTLVALSRLGLDAMIS
jgi:hypothetical protein